MTLTSKIAEWMIRAVLIINPLTIQCSAKAVDYFSPIITQIEAEHVLTEEKEKLGMKLPVVFQLGELPEGYRAFCGIHPDKEEGIIVANPTDISRILIRHELYHLAEKHYQPGKAGKVGRNIEDTLGLFKKGGYLPNPDWTQKLILYYEPAAYLYSITGIRL
ncbi:MAG: hypothetical protein WCV90_00910 [Candidatus Woesearchaeota archaeon]|jgi:hypothetical protein